MMTPARPGALEPEPIEDAPATDGPKAKPKAGKKAVAAR